MKPLFIIGGAPKCGTTALWDYLNEHPQVGMASIKEPRFFSKAEGNTDLSKDAYGPRLPGTFSRGFQWYEELFPNSDALVFGEASTVYFGDETSPKLIKDNVPDARLIFLLREPVARLYSHYWQEFKLGWDLPDFYELYQSNHPRFQYYCQVSAYQRNLKRYFTYFPKEQILILLQEDLVERPKEVFSVVCDHIGIDNQFQPSSLGKQFNKQQAPRSRILAKYVSSLQAITTKLPMPKRVRKKLGRLRQMVTQINSGENQYSSLDDGFKRELSKRFEPDIEYLQILLGRDLSKWQNKE